ncbi:MAG: secretin N-terminal domain-containing protein, partial [Candidatus Omnitrophota bacterium]
PTVTHFFALNYAKAEDMKSKLEPLLTKGIGQINIDERTNKVIVTDLESNFPGIRNAVTEFDEKTKEVLIEAKILQISLNDEYKAGINWDTVLAGMDSILGLNFDVDSTITVPSSASTAGAALRIKNLNSDGYEAMVKFLQQYGKTNLLSSPRIVTINNEEAKILVGTNQPYATSQTTVGSAGAPVRSYQITFLDLGVKLYVTPTVNREGFITMKIKPEVSSVTDTLIYGDQDDKVPVVKTSQAETTVMAKDGTTIVIAGLIETRDEMSVNKVPLLGDIPFFGGLFRSTSTGSSTNPEKQELIIFLTPHIITGEKSSSEVVGYDTMLNSMEDKFRQGELMRDEEQIEESVSGNRYEEAPAEDKTAKEAKTYSDEAKNLISDQKIPARVAASAGVKPITVRDYYENVRSKIYENIKQFYPDGEEKGEVFLSFSVLRNGSLKGAPEILKPVSEALKEAAIKSVQSSAPFEPFPKHFAKSQETFKILVVYE